MTREQYLHMRKTHQYDMSLFYAYYCKNATKTPIPFESFAPAFEFYFQANNAAIFEKLDTQFSVNSLLAKNGDTIMAF